MALYHEVALTSALHHLEQGLCCVTYHRHALHGVLHPEIVCLLMSGIVLWCLGYPDRARTRIHEGLDVAQQLAHPHYQVWGLHVGAVFYQLSRDARAVGELAEATVAQASEQQIQLGLTEGRLLRQWALAQENVRQADIDVMHRRSRPIVGTATPRDSSVIWYSLPRFKGAADRVKTDWLNWPRLKRWWPKRASICISQSCSVLKASCFKRQWTAGDKPWTPEAYPACS